MIVMSLPCSVCLVSIEARRSPKAAGELGIPVPNWPAMTAPTAVSAAVRACLCHGAMPIYLPLPFPKACPASCLMAFRMVSTGLVHAAGRTPAPGAGPLAFPAATDLAVGRLHCGRHDFACPAGEAATVGATAGGAPSTTCHWVLLRLGV